MGNKLRTVAEVIDKWAASYTTAAPACMGWLRIVQAIGVTSKYMYISMIPALERMRNAIDRDMLRLGISARLAANLYGAGYDGRERAVMILLHYDVIPGPLQRLRDGRGHCCSCHYARHCKHSPVSLLPALSLSSLDASPMTSHEAVFCVY